MLKSSALFNQLMENFGISGIIIQRGKPWITFSVIGRNFCSQAHVQKFGNECRET